MSADDLLHSPMVFAEETLGMKLYDWQDEVLEWFDVQEGETVRGSLATPNGAGKSAVVIASLVLWWLAMHRQGKVVITTKDGKQLDNQLQPAITAQRSKFPRTWKFIDRLIETPSGGRCVMFTTDEPGRAEGWHKLDDLDGPLLIVVDEAKSIPEEIFQAIDRCTYNAILFASSPGQMIGSFYDSQFKPELGYQVKRVGLKDCPHIPQDRIDQIIAKYGEDSAFTMSTLHGEFVEADIEARFDKQGIAKLKAVAETQHPNARRGVIEEHRGNFMFREDPDGWLWMTEEPSPGLSYMAIADPMTGEQSEGSTTRDNHATGILRDAYMDANRTAYMTELVAAIHVEAGCKWDIDVLAQRIWLMTGYYGKCTIAPEANNSGMALMAELKHLDVDIWQRTDPDHINPNRTVKKSGFMTNSKTKAMWVERLAKEIREETFMCKYLPAVTEMSRFALLPNGSCRAQEGFHDDWVSAIAIGLLVGCYTRMPMPVPVNSYQSYQTMTTRNRCVA